MAVPVVASAEAGVAKIALSKELCGHTCTETHTARTICVLLLPLGWFVPLEPTLCNTDRPSVLWLSHRVILGCWEGTFPSTVMFCLSSTFYPQKPEPETSPPSSIFKKPNPSFRGEKEPGHGFSPQSMAQAHHGLCIISGTKPSQ